MPSNNRGNSHLTNCSFRSNNWITAPRYSYQASGNDYQLQNQQFKELGTCPKSWIALSYTKIVSRQVWECAQGLNELAKVNFVNLIWEPGHSGILGNEKADYLASTAGSTIKNRKCIQAWQGKRSSYRLQ